MLKSVSGPSPLTSLSSAAGSITQYSVQSPLAGQFANYSGSSLSLPASLSSSSSTAFTINYNTRHTIPNNILNATPSTGQNSLTVSLDGTASHDPEGGTITSYVLDFGDGSPTVSGTTTASHFYSQPGAYKATLTVTNQQNAIAVGTATIVVTGGVAPSAPKDLSYQIIGVK